MIPPTLPAARQWLTTSQHRVLFAVVCGLVLCAYERPDTVLGRVIWVVDVGLFMLWQPIVSAERRLTWYQVLFTNMLVLFLALNLNWGWLAAWGVFVASLVGGKVIVARGRRLGWYYLLAFATLALIMFVWISPRLFGGALAERDATVNAWGYWIGFTALLTTAVVMPWGKTREDHGVYDFLVSLLVLLVLSFVLMLTGVLMTIHQASHFEALVSALLSLGVFVLLLSWSWNPRLGFSGLGALASRYLLRLGFPFEDWLRGLSDAFDREEDPDAFLMHAIGTLSDLPWVLGGGIRVEGRVLPGFGQATGPEAVLEYEGVEVTLHTTYHWSAALVWQANLLLKLVVDFYHAKLRDRQLQQMRYLQVVHETGSRATHAVKNLLQSLEGLCFAVEQATAADSAELAELVRRQLPMVSQRLRLTLDKLSTGTTTDPAFVPLVEWWQSIQERYRAQEVGFTQSVSAPANRIPGTVFDNVVDNLLANAIQKRSQHPGLHVTVSLVAAGEECVVRIEDDGPQMPEAVAARLFDGPVASAGGLGVGLYHAAQLAERYAYRLSLASNRSGGVAFELRPASRTTSSGPI